MDLLIETINSADLGWKADTCKMQPDHEMYCQESEAVQVDSSEQKDKTANQTFEFGEGPGFK